MKKNYNWSLIIMLALAVSGLSAQETDPFDQSQSEFSKQKQTVVSEQRPAEDSKALVTETVIQPTVATTPAIALPEEYTGFKVQFWLSETALPAEHEIFFRHGNVVEEQLPGGQFAYLVGEFATEEDAYTFAKTFLKPNYPEARVVQYEKGTRIR